MKKLSKLGLGTAHFGMKYGFSSIFKAEEIDAVLESCRDLGISHLDTAAEYGASEELIGDYLSRNKGADEEFVIATKLRCMNKETVADKGKLKKFISDSVENSLSSLKIKKIDILYLHHPEDFIINNDFFWGIMMEVKNKGFFESLGISVYDTDETGKLIDEYSEYIDFLQVPYNIFDRRFGSILPNIREKGIRIVSRSVFLKGIITADNIKIPDELSRIIPFKERLSGIADKNGLSVYEIALLFAAASEYIDSTIVGAASVRELEANVKALEKVDAFRKIVEGMDELIINERFLIDPRKWSQI